MFTLDQFLQALKTGLAKAVEAQRVVVETASTPDDVVELLKTSPQAYRLILMVDEGEAIDEGLGSMEQIKLNFVLQGAKSLGLDRGQSAFLNVLEAVRQAARGLVATGPQVDGDEPLLNESIAGDFDSLEYKGFRWLSIEDLPTRQVQMMFEATVALIPPTMTPIELPQWRGVEIGA